MRSNTDQSKLYAHLSLTIPTCHVRLIEHSNAGDHRIVGHSDAADIVVSRCSDLTCTACPMARRENFPGSMFVVQRATLPVEPIIGVTRVRVSIVTAEIVTSSGVLHASRIERVASRGRQATYVVIHQVRMRVVHAIVHDGGGHVLAGVAECPCGFDVEIESRFAARLTDVFLPEEGGEPSRESASTTTSLTRYH